MSHRSLVLTVAGGALAIGLAVGLMLNRPNAVEQTPAQFPAISLYQASIFLRHHGQKQAELHSERVEVSRDLRYATFTGNPTAVVFEAGREVLRIRGSRIVLDRQTNDVTVHGPVEVITAQGGRLSAGTAQWSNVAQQIVFQQAVMMALGDQELTAEQLTIDVGNQVLDLSGGVDIAFHMEGAKP